MGRQRTAQLQHKEAHVTLSEHESDAPLLPIVQIERLHAICPDKVPWVFDETTKEGNFRRSETTRINTLVFVERMAGVAAGLFIGYYAISTALELAMAGHDWVAGIIGGTTVVGLVSAFLIGVKRRAPSNRTNPPK